MPCDAVGPYAPSSSGGHHTSVPVTFTVFYKGKSNMRIPTSLPPSNTILMSLHPPVKLPFTCCRYSPTPMSLSFSITHITHTHTHIYTHTQCICTYLYVSDLVTINCPTW